MRPVAMATIRAYQRYRSRSKGFRCAYRAATGRASGSALGHRTIRRHGVVGGIALLRSRTHRDLPTPEGLCDRMDCCTCDWPRRHDDRRAAAERSVYVPFSGMPRQR